MKDAFDLGWEWAEKPLDSGLTIPAEIHNPVMALSEEDRHDREKVNEAVRRYQESQANWGGTTLTSSGTAPPSWPLGKC